MPEENLLNDQTQDTTNGTNAVESNEDYIKVIQDLKQNSVPKEEYDKLKLERKELINALVSGQSIDMPKEEKIDQDALRKELYGDDVSLSNRDYWLKTMQLRKAIMDEGKPDPFLPNGINIQATQLDVDSANLLAQAVTESLEASEENPEAFTSIFLSKFRDVNLPKRNSKR